MGSLESGREELSAEQAKILSALQQSYAPQEGMPTWEQIDGQITTEMLDRAIEMDNLHFGHAILVQSPNVTREEMIASIDEYEKPLTASEMATDAKIGVVREVLYGQVSEPRSTKSVMSPTRIGHFDEEESGEWVEEGMGSLNDDVLWNGGEPSSVREKFVVKIVSTRQGFRLRSRENADLPDDKIVEDRISILEGKGLKITRSLDTVLAILKMQMAKGGIPTALRFPVLLNTKDGEFAVVELKFSSIENPHLELRHQPYMPHEAHILTEIDVGEF